MILFRRMCGALACALLALCATPVATAQVDASGATASGFQLTYEISPRQLEAAQFETTAQITRDAQSLRVHVLAVDPHPGEIVAQQARFDAVPGGDDAIQLAIVPQDNGRRVYTFNVNAAGARGDFIDSSSGEGAYNWNGEWSAKATRTPQGYTVDFVIPFATLGLEPGTLEARTLRFNITRRIGHGRGETLSIAPVDTRKPCEECQFVALPLATVAQSTDATPAARTTRFRLQPYAVASSARDFRNPVNSASKAQFDAGLDAQWFITPRDVLVATVNPDFAQVESDTIQFDINRRYVQFLPERRSFFTNESGAFATPMNLLYTRLIANPTLGLQYVRHRDNYDLGVLYADDATTTWIRPGVDGSSRVFLDRPSQNLVARVKARHGKFRYGLATTLRSAGDYRDAVVAVDGGWDAGSRSVLTGQLAFSDACDPAVLAFFAAGRCMRGTAVSVSHNYGGERWSNYVSVSRTARDFRADLGSIRQAGVRNVLDVVQYQRTLPRGRALERWSGSLGLNRTDALGRGLLEQSLFASVSGSTTHATLSFNSFLQQAVFLGRRFDQGGWSIYANHRPNGRVQYFASVGRQLALDYAGLRTGHNTDASASISLKPDPRFDVNLSISADRFDVREQPLYWTASTSLRANVHLTERHHVSMFFNGGQSRVFFAPPGNAVDDLNARYQLTYQYKPTAFRYFVAGVSGASARRDGEDRLRPQSAFGFVKYVHDLSW